jgi:RND family efflux transporter MFP subunit
LTLCGCGTKAKKEAVAEAIPVQCQAVETQDIKRSLNYAASIHAEDQASVFPKVTGKIIEKLKDDGDAVEKGDIIAYVDRDEIGFKFEKAPVESPLKGIIGKVSVDRGDNVSPQNPIAEVVNIDNVHVTLDIPEKYLPSIALEQAAEIMVDAFAGQIFTGKVFKISPILDTQTRTAPIEIFIANADHKLKSGMFARTTLILEKKANALLIPKEAVIGKEPDTIVYTVNNNVAHQRKVRLGIREGSKVEVLEGLNAGEEVVIMGQQRLRHGAKVSNP